tara:strand:- start:157690 stop:158766 length:1077 start_codon:yes stop_codon:yes gene_type:complete
MKIASILGARPQFVKAAMLSKEWAKLPEIEECIIHTGQHFDKNMSQVFFEEMNIPKPQYNLDINSQSHAEMTGNMMMAIEKVLLKEKPDWVVVFGDTNSTLAGALVAKKLGIKIAHIEAGLRSYNNAMPEEINRIIVDRISDLLFCPSQGAMENLKEEGQEFGKSHSVLSGDIMFDALLNFKDLAIQNSSLKLGLENKAFALATIHREGNTKDWENLKEIIEALEEINKNLRIVLVAHPRTKRMLQENNWQSSLILIEAQSYFSMLSLMSDSDLIITDSGGLQKEAYWMKKPCLIIREETEWMELVENGNNLIAGTSRNGILEAYLEIKDRKLNFEKPFFGNGTTAKCIVEEILKFSM